MSDGCAQDSKRAELKDCLTTTFYGQLRAIARRERALQSASTLDTTSVVSEAWLKLNARQGDIQSRAHYLATAAIAMRQILVDHARYRYAECRNPALVQSLDAKVGVGHDALEVTYRLGGAEEPLLAGFSSSSASAMELLALDQALDRLDALDPDLARLVELRFYAGLTLDDIAQLKGVTVRTITRLWSRARALLKMWLMESP